MVLYVMLIIVLCVCFFFFLALQVSLLEEKIKPRSDLPPLLVGLHERKPEKLHYLGVSFGITQSLYNFWQKRKFVPVYVRQTPVSSSLSFYQYGDFLQQIVQHLGPVFRTGVAHQLGRLYNHEVGLNNRRC